MVEIGHNVKDTKNYVKSLVTSRNATILENLCEITISFLLTLNEECRIRAYHGLQCSRVGQWQCDDQSIWPPSSFEGKAWAQGCIQENSIGRVDSCETLDGASNGHWSREITSHFETLRLRPSFAPSMLNKVTSKATMVLGPPSVMSF